MPIYIRLSQLIFKKSIVEQKFPGGVEKLKAMYKYDPAKHSIVSVGSYPTGEFFEDSDLISFTAMNSDELDLSGIVDHFQLVTNEEDEIISSTDFVILERYGGRMWDCDWLKDNTLFIWDVAASAEAVKELERRSAMTMDEWIENPSLSAVIF